LKLLIVAALPVASVLLIASPARAGIACILSSAGNVDCIGDTALGLVVESKIKTTPWGAKVAFGSVQGSYVIDASTLKYHSTD